LDGRVRAYDLVVSPWRFLRADLSGPIREELTAIRALLGEEDAGLAGIAMMERLLTDGTSSLHDDDVGRLREDLRRARVLLELRSAGY
jgi:hypothetical protein